MPKIFTDRAPAPVPSSDRDVHPLPRTAALLGTVMDWTLHLTVFLVPLVFSTQLLDVLELPKQTLLAFFASVGVIAWIGKALAEKRFSFSRSWLHIVVGVFLVGYLIVTSFSLDRYVSFVGNLGQMPWAFATTASLVGLYFVAVNRVRNATQVYNLVFTFLASALVAGTFGLLQAMGWHLFSHPFTRNRTFTTVGSIYSLAYMQIAPLLIAASLAFHGCRDRVCVLGEDHPLGKLARVLVWATVVVSLTVLMLVDMRPAWAILVLGTLILVGLGQRRSRVVGHPAKLALPALLLVISAFLFFFKTPFRLSLPAEVSPSVRASWEIARDTLQERPLFGSGPGTWSRDYARYRQAIVNQSPFWNIRFDRSHSTFFTLLATLGIIGTGLWLLLLFSGIVKSAKHLVAERNDDLWHAYLMVFTGWAALSAVSFVYNFNMAHVVSWWMLFALLGSLVARDAAAWDARKNGSLFGILSVAFAVVFVGLISVLWVAGQRVVADRLFSRAVTQFRNGETIERVLSILDRADRLNPLNDMYARNLSQAHLIRVTQKVAARPAAADFPQLLELVSATVDKGLEARRRSPENVDNWANLGLIYQSVASYTRGADEHAIENYRQASLREPYNPTYLTEIGRLYLLRSDAYRLALGRDANRQEVERNVQENLEKALTYLRRAIAAKSDYFPAHYHLGIVYERQGSLKEAILELERFLQANPNEAGVAFELALLYYRNNEKDRARDLLAQIVRIQPDNDNARWYLSSLYEERGELDQAIATLAPLAEKLQTNAAVQERFASLKAVRDARRGPSVRPLPDPLREDVRNQTEQDPVRR